MGRLTNCVRSSTRNKEPEEHAGPPLIVPKVWDHASPSQFKLHASCERKWYIQYILGRKSPTSPAMERGTRLHAMLENYFRAGKLTYSAKDRATWGAPNAAEQKLAMEGLDRYHKAHAGTPWAIEEKISVPTRHVPIVGYIDLWSPGFHKPLIYDHKTTSSWRWIHTPESLAKDPQCTVYMAHALEVTGAPKAQFSHVYYLTKEGQKTKRIRTTTVERTAEQVLLGMDALTEQVGRMLELSTCPDPGESKPNWDACNDYGGCPFKSYCHKYKQGGGILMGMFSKKTTAKKSKPATKATTQTEKPAGKTAVTGLLGREAVASAAPDKDPEVQTTSTPVEGPVNPPADVAAPESTTKKKATKAAKPKKGANELGKLTQVTMAMMAYAGGGADETMVAEAVTLAKEVLRQTDGV